MPYIEYMDFVEDWAKTIEEKAKRNKKQQADIDAQQKKSDAQSSRMQRGMGRKKPQAANRNFKK